MRSKRRSPLPGLHWLLIAVGLCWLSWPAPAEAAPACAHSLCELGDNLSEICNPCPAGDPYCTFPSDCVDTICSDPTDQNSSRFCCLESGLWDQGCIDAVLEVCGDPTCEQVCSHSPCVAGPALDSTCNSCTALVCFDHPECCTDDGDPLTDDWDAACVGYFEQDCGIQCEPGENICSNALPISPGVIHGTLLGSSNDGCASAEGSPGGVSCNSGDVWYSYTQGFADEMLISTCTSQRSFAIDSVVSVHTGCPGKKNNEIVANDDWRLGNARDACTLDTPSPNNVDAGILLGGGFALDPGETVVIRVAHHKDSIRNPFQLKVVPEPDLWLALVAGAGALGALSRRRARG